MEAQIKNLEGNGIKKKLILNSKKKKKTVNGGTSAKTMKSVDEGDDFDGRTDMMDVSEKQFRESQANLGEL